ncbi:glycosyltransferase [Pontibacter beigongshangensis]|uniref:glycosyltransferase n=1 Tax=Pontibacter beigongshangensis TaxID=2574733 RepID=UPI00164F8571|nr:glycosyltransferase [Pontibacter beigongshangensis]
MKLGITVVICTYNGAALLPETIHHIARQRVRPEISWEFIIIDNASTDNTSEVAASEWEKTQSQVSFSLLYQPKQGLTYARELALEKSQFEFIIFCDDDNWLAPDYINRAYDLMLQHPLIGVLGGYGELVFETAPPPWAAKFNLFASGPQAPASGKVSRNVVYGAGCVIRKSAYNILIRSGFRSMLTDRFAKTLCAGGDYELCYAIALAGYDIWYDHSLRFKHFMPKERVCWDYHIRFFRDGAQSFEVLIPYRIRVNNGSESLLSFNLKFLAIFFSYIRKLPPLLLEQIRVPAASEEAKVNKLKLISLKSKIMTLTRYAAMKENFFKLLKFEQAELNLFRIERNKWDSAPIRAHNINKADQAEHF